MDIEYKKSNREKRMAPGKAGRIWCKRCDRDLVGVGEKCGYCGHIRDKRTYKKETNAR